VGLRRSLTALREPDALAELADQGVPEVRRHSIATLLGVVDDLDRQLGPLDLELRPLARADRHAGLLATIPGVAELLGLTIAKIGEVSRFPSARRLVGYAGLVPRIKQSGQSSRVGRLSKAGPTTLRWAAVEAAQQAWRPNNPWHRLYSDVKSRHGKSNPAKAAVARKVLIADLARARPRTALHPPRHRRDRSRLGKLLHSSGRLRPKSDLRSRGSCNSSPCADESAERDISSRCHHDPPRRHAWSRHQLDISRGFKETSGWSAAVI
jgi:hypothetical protein